jgi:hypothetical protein
MLENKQQSYDLRRGGKVMATFQELEYTSITLTFEKEMVYQLIERLIEVGLSVAWKESNKIFALSVRTEEGTQRLTFKKISEKMCRLSHRNYLIKDKRFAAVLHQLLEETKGHAVAKFIRQGQVVVQNIRYGEPVKIVEINGTERKILYEKECTVSMDQVLEALKRKDAEQRISVLRLEIDYELATLHEAMEKNDWKTILACKERLEALRREMLVLEV